MNNNRTNLHNQDQNPQQQNKNNYHYYPIDNYKQSPQNGKQFNFDCKRSQPLLPYHQYISQSHYSSNKDHKYQNDNSKSAQYQRNTSYSNRSYQSNKYYNSHPNYYQNQRNYTQNQQTNYLSNPSLNNYSFSSYNSDSSLPTYQQFKKRNLYHQQTQFNKTRDKLPTFDNKFDQNKRYQEKIDKSQKNQPIERQKVVDSYSSDENDVSDQSFYQEDEQMLYLKPNYYQRQNTKTKFIHKKKDPIIDSPQEIKKWIEMRKKNYPRRFTLKQGEEKPSFIDEQKKQLSKLQQKIRKKIQIINGDSKNLLKKLRNIDILRRIISDPKLLQKNKRKQEKKIQELKKIRIQNKKVVKQYVSIQVSEQSAISIQPVQQPICKIQNIISQKEKEENKNSVQKNEFLFEYKDLKNQKPDLQLIQSKKDLEKIEQPEQIILHLREKQNEDKISLNTLFDYKSNSHNYKYKIQTLQVNFKLQEIFQQTSHLLQAIRYIIKQDFFQDKA